MKRICQLAFAFFWLTAPVVTFVLLRSGAQGSYPFFAALACIYRFLHRSTDIVFLFLVPALFIVWTLLTAACFMLDQYPSLKVVLYIMTATELLFALNPSFYWYTVAMDVLPLLVIFFASRTKASAIRNP